MVDRIARKNHLEILIVEDSPTQAENLKFILEKKGFTVSVASNGKEALAFLNTGKPDIVVTDILMPKMDGYELCRQIRKNWNFMEMPVILVTALSAPVDVIKGLEVGANNFITKPYDEEHLISRIQYLIANRDLRKGSRAETDGNVIFSGQNYHITADRLQILDLLLSTYENTYRQNRELLRAQKELTELNERLEETIQERDTEIAERRLAEEALIRAKEEWERTFAGVPDLIAILDHQHRVLRVNAAMARRLGVKPEEAVGLRCFEVVHGLSEPPHYCPHSRTMKDGRQHVEEVHDERLGGDFVVSTTPLYDDQKKMIGTVHVAHDVTERKRAEEAVRSARDELELRVRERTEALRRQADLLELAHDAILVRDMDGKIAFWNHGAEEMYGWTRDEAEGAVTHHLLKTKFPVSFDDTATTLMREGKWEGELEHTTKDGRKITVLSRHALQRDEAGNPVAIMEINLDITAAKQAEEQLRQAQKMEAVGTLAGGIAHDFNNVLAAMIGFAELAADDIPADSKAQHHLKRVQEAGLRARELVKQILAFSRKGEGQRKQVSLTSLVKETHALLRASLPTTIQMPLAITTSDDYVLADPTQIQQVLMNLATNGAHAMRDGGQLTIGLSSVTFPRGSLLPDPDMGPGTYVKLTVTDMGTGMTEEVRRRIFEPFFTTKAPGKGTGMGLAVVYGVVKSHGGAVTVQTETGKGSIFDVYLPRAQKPEVSREETLTSALPTGIERILFVDDEEMLVEIARNMLESLGYQVTVAKDPTDAWNLFIEEPSRFDLVITDQTMPDTTGITLAQKMLRVRKGLPVILCTGYSEMVSADKAKEAGICEFVMKPMVRKELAETIRRVLDGRKE